jgi:hypothetical protein
MKKITPLLVFLAFMGGERLLAQTPSPKKRLWGGVELSVAPSVVDVNYDYDGPEDDSHTTTNLGVNAFGGVYLSPRFSVGIGTGVSYLDGIRVLCVPVLGEVKYISPVRRRENVSSFVYGRGGYPFLPGRNKGGGVLAGAGLGVTFGDSQKPGYSVSAGYSLTHLDYRAKSGRTHAPSRHAVELRLGLLW